MQGESPFQCNRATQDSNPQTMSEFVLCWGWASAMGEEGARAPPPLEQLSLWLSPGCSVILAVCGPSYSES